MDSEEESQPKKRKDGRYSLFDFENLRSSEQDEFLFNVTDDMGEDSECCGDSEADDNIDHSRKPSKMTTSTPMKNITRPGTSAGNVSTGNEGNHHLFSNDDDSDYIDDSDADPTYEPSVELGNYSRTSRFDDSSDNDEGDITEQVDTNNSENGDSSAEETINPPTISKKSKTIKKKKKEPPPTPFSKTSTKPDTFTNFTFSHQPGPKVPIDVSTPSTVFLFIIGPVLDLIINESNLFASQHNVNLTLTREELLAFFGILIIMGFHKLPSMRLYWSNDPAFHVDIVSKVMTLHRFLRILRYIHLNDNSKMSKRGENNYDKLYKLRPFSEFLKKRFLEIFNPCSRFLSIDESMVGFKGRSSLKQYLPNKPTKRGFKVWVLACAVTGYMLYFDVYEGKNSKKDKDDTLGEHVVLGLAKIFEGLGYCLFFDRFFSNIPLMTKLLSKKLFGCGTIQADRKGFPKHLLKADNTMKMGDSDFVSDGEVSIVTWKDRGKKSVKIISNMHDPEQITEIQRKSKTGEKGPVKCPQAVADYNSFMGGVDHFDHYQSVYSIIQKSRRWWLKIFYFLLDSVIVNSYIIYKYVTKRNRGKAMTQLIFRKKLAEELIGTFSSRTSTRSGCYKGKKISGRSVKDMNMSDVGLHMPIMSSSRRCGRCSSKQKPKRSNIECSKCKVALCIPCFAPFHNA